MKAIKILELTKQLNDDVDFIETIDEAIKELEELNNRSCIKCNTYYMKCKIFNIYWKKSESSLIIDANNFCCNKYELKQ